MGEKKSICTSDVICLTFSSLRVMNGKVRKQLTKSVDGKQTQSSCEICDMFAERSVFSVFGLIQFRTQNGLINQVGWREYGTFMSI